MKRKGLLITLVLVSVIALAAAWRSPGTGQQLARGLILISPVLPGGRLDEAALEKMLREYKIHEDIMNIMNWVDSYRAAEGVMPESIDQLEEWSEAKVVWRPTPSLLRSLTRQDPWGRDYVYSPATPQGWCGNDPFAHLLSAPARIICFGRDGKSGGEGDDKDIEVFIVDIADPCSVKFPDPPILLPVTPDNFDL